MSETREFRRPFVNIGKTLNDIRKLKATITCYLGSKAQPQWADTEPGKFLVSAFCLTIVLTSGEDMYTTRCTIEADLSELCKSLKPRKAFDTMGTFYIANFEIALLFGMTEFKALSVWKDEDVSRLRQ